MFNVTEQRNLHDVQGIMRINLMPVRLALLTAKNENLSAVIERKKIAKPILSHKTIYRNKTMIILTSSEMAHVHPTTKGFHCVRKTGTETGDVTVQR